ncbi:putative protein OS=Afipia felis OX=1035 GN=NCTC12722_03042 PE=4 SV=1 [Afipia felis]
MVKGDRMADQGFDGAARNTGAGGLRAALHKARIEAADRTGVVVDLRDAEAARLEILNEALDPLFSEIPRGVDLFDRGISQGDTPRLWIDSVAHIAMGRDKRIYRLVQDTRFGRTVLAELHDVPVMVDAVTDYIARRIIERDRALVSALPAELIAPARSAPVAANAASRFWPFVLGVAVGAAALFGIALLAALRGM